MRDISDSNHSAVPSNILKIMNFYFFVLYYVLRFLRQGRTVYPWLVWNLQKSACLCLTNTRLKSCATMRGYEFNFNLLKMEGAEPGNMTCLSEGNFNYMKISYFHIAKEIMYLKMYLPSFCCGQNVPLAKCPSLSS